MPFYDKFSFEQLRQVCNSKCHNCGDVYLCIKCQKDLINRAQLCIEKNSPEDVGQVHDAENPVDRNMVTQHKFIVRILKAIIKNGFCVVKNLVSIGKARKTLEEIRKAYRIPGKFSAGKLSNGAMNRVRSLQGVRGDSVTWLDGLSEECPNVSQVAKQMNKLALSLYHANNVAMNHVSKSKIMVSCYDGDGKAYKRHIDSRRDGSLKLTFIYYLNEDYTEDQGGSLRIHSDRGTIDIPPELGSLAIFQSDKLVHEVLPTYCQRFAFTIWYMEVPKRKAFKPIDDDELENETDKLSEEDKSPKIYLQSKKIKVECDD